MARPLTLKETPHAPFVDYPSERHEMQRFGWWLTREQAKARVMRDVWLGLAKMRPLSPRDERKVRFASDEELFEWTYEDWHLIEGMVLELVSALPTIDLKVCDVREEDVSWLLQHVTGEGENEGVWEHCWRDNPDIIPAMARVIRAKPEAERRLIFAWRGEVDLSDWISDEAINDEQEEFVPWFLDGCGGFDVLDHDWWSLHLKHTDPLAYADVLRREREVGFWMLNGLLGRDVQ